MNKLNKNKWCNVASSWCLFFGVTVLFGTAQGEVLSFGWDLPQTGHVRSKISENGRHSVILYKLTAKKLDGDRIEIIFSDASFETEGGSRPIEVANDLPSLVIDRGGHYQGLKDVGIANKKLLDKVPVEIEKKDRENWERKLEDPEFLRSMNQRFEGIWNTWVGTWNGLSVDQGYGFETGDKMSLKLEGKVLDYEYLGLQKNFCERCIKLRCESSLARREATATVQRSLGEIQGRDKIILEDAGSSTITEVVTDADKLIPYYAKASTHVLLKVKDMDAIRREVTQEYWFDWVR